MAGRARWKLYRLDKLKVGDRFRFADDMDERIVEEVPSRGQGEFKHKKATRKAKPLKKGVT